MNKQWQIGDFIAVVDRARQNTGYPLHAVTTEVEWHREAKTNSKGCSYPSPNGECMILGHRPVDERGSFCLYCGAIFLPPSIVKAKREDGGEVTPDFLYQWLVDVVKERGFRTKGERVLD
ncbi:MAG: hypothetical protein AUK00_00240 [Dehalococcoidia bacterium CG2_30_46_9]|nr:MAG: hypothetical protein AUK00_00240 [Dehalococcoidia bacterium CG2_30_46_9]